MHLLRDKRRITIIYLSNNVACFPPFVCFRGFNAKHGKVNRLHFVARHVTLSLHDLVVVKEKRVEYVLRMDY